MKEITCLRCKKVGHYRSKCKEELSTKTYFTDEESSVEQDQDTDDKKGQ